MRPKKTISGFKVRCARVALVALFCLIVSCDRGNKEESLPDFLKERTEPNLSVNISLFKQDLNYFAYQFRKKDFKTNMISWSSDPNSLNLSQKQTERLTPLIFVDSKIFTKDVLALNFKHAFYFLDQVWVEKKFNNKPYPDEVLILIRDFLKGDFRFENNVELETLEGIRSYSAILRLIKEISDPRELSPELTKSFGNMPFERQKSILTKTAYDSVIEKFSQLQSSKKEQDNPALECSKYWAIAPILKFDERFKDYLKELERLAKEAHQRLNNAAEPIHGELFDHLRCVETLEEAIGKSIDPATGDGILDDYLKFIVNRLWDFPFFGRQCAPYRGILGNIPILDDKVKNYCEANFKSVSDNLYLVYIIDRFGSKDELSVEGNYLMKEGRDVRKINALEESLN